MNINYEKGDGLIPAIIQDAASAKVLMLGFMNKEAYDKTVAEKRVTFYSRTKNRLWMKGEESGNFLDVEEILLDCDNDTLLIKAVPRSPVCHKGTMSCFGDEGGEGLSFLVNLDRTIAARKDVPVEGSYTSTLFSGGVDRLAQKVGEEAVEVLIAAKNGEREPLLNEAADLLFHLMVLLRERELRLEDVVKVLQERH